jgi:predicted permease
VFILSLVLLMGSPPAITLSQMTQAVAGDAFERLVSRTIFWAYCIITPPSTIVLSMISLYMSKI